MEEVGAAQDGELEEKMGTSRARLHCYQCQICTVLYMTGIFSVQLEKNFPFKCLSPYFSTNSAGFSSSISDERIRL